jgi:phosphopantothenoylcysteine decarboxylase/phosphopantothenate--cysteine ligase
MTNPRILLIVGGGIAAYKACELIRLMRQSDMDVRCILTAGGAHFITPMTLAALSGQPVHTSLWDLKDEAEIGHIQLSRDADLVVVAPATADLLARMACGIADDLATNVLLATDKPVMVAPAMNVRMWQHAATRRNIAQLQADGVMVLEPDAGSMACGEIGAGRLPEPTEVMSAIRAMLAPNAKPLSGRHVLITAGPTHEPIDPVRYLANRSSGRQGFAIARALSDLGARVTLIAGPVTLATPAGISRIDVETGREMAEAVKAALPADAAIMVAAVADWRVEAAAQKLKKSLGVTPSLNLEPNPDILAIVSAGPDRPALVVGFAAETENVLDHARAKLVHKGCDWIVANDVCTGVMGGANNSVHLITREGVESWPDLPKEQVGRRLAERVAEALSASPKSALAAFVNDTAG